MNPIILPIAGTEVNIGAQPLLEAMRMPPESKATRKGSRFYYKGLPITACPYTNTKRKQQFECAWMDAESYTDWTAEAPQ